MFFFLCFVKQIAIKQKQSVVRVIKNHEMKMKRPHSGKNGAHALINKKVHNSVFYMVNTPNK